MRPANVPPGAPLRKLERQGRYCYTTGEFPGCKVNVDHITITTAGVVVIDSRSYRSPVWIDTAGRLFRARYSLQPQVDTVRWLRDKVAETPGSRGLHVPVRSLICVHGQPLPRSELMTAATPIVAPRDLCATLRSLEEVLDEDEMIALARRARACLQPAAQTHRAG